MEFKRRSEKSLGHSLRVSLYGMVTDDRVLGLVSSVYEPHLFEGPASLVAQWCVDYYKKFAKAPKKRIRDRFERYAEENGDEVVVRSVETLLRSISGLSAQDYEFDFLVDETNRYLQTRQKSWMEEQIEPLKTARELADWVSGNSVISLLGNDCFNLRSLEAWQESLGKQDESPESLIHLPDGIAPFFGTSLRRGGFVAFQAPEKTGKSFWMQELFYLACTQRRALSAFYFECGDLTESDFTDRMLSRVIRKPIEGNEVLVPVSNGNGFEWNVLQVPAMTMADKHRAASLFVSRSRKRHIEFHSAPSGTFSVADIRSRVLTHKQRTGRAPDVVFIDYADILNHALYGEGRDGINQSWMKLRALALEFDLLVVTATQASAGSYGQVKQNLSHFSDDKRKYAHVTGMVALQPNLEITEGRVWMAHWLVKRHGKSTPPLMVAGALDVARPFAAVARLGGPPQPDPDFKP